MNSIQRFPGTFVAIIFVLLIATYLFATARNPVVLPEFAASVDKPLPLASISGAECSANSPAIYITKPNAFQKLSYGVSGEARDGVEFTGQATGMPENTLFVSLVREEGTTTVWESSVTVDRAFPCMFSGKIPRDVSGYGKYVIQAYGKDADGKVLNQVSVPVELEPAKVSD